ncbi:hypothetical protein PG913_12465 [Tenacibaculum pacificus]|uniref:type IX secretion system periplasmic lipoprotein PorW/SprE n=1 Tax=Tenacibaculum pacificus TaxID=3018314 RepID=UPI0022F3FF91|nr:hypothetical protein [Tenacibaculum pacificus]WBX73625.1 hypothetical protein PG913_12465 [Tenacibaculum pacificus]
MTATERTSFFETYIEKIKKEDEEKKQLLLNAQNFGSSFGTGKAINNGSNKGKWYFYNSQALGFGKEAFQNTWGMRPLEDNWRLSDKSTTIIEEVDEDSTEPVVNLRYELSTYLDEIPTDEKIITTLKEDRNDALYQLGLIYKEQFKNSNLAIKNLERLQKEQQNNTLELPISYHLYQIYSEINDMAKANEYKSVILTKYSETTFAEIIRNPTRKLTENKKEDAVLDKYKEIYYLYKEQKYEAVVKDIDVFLSTIKESELTPKLVLLKALSLGKYKDKETYRKALEFVAIRYANKAEGVKAKEILDRIK